MNDDPISLDSHRGMIAQKETDLRRVLADVETKSAILRKRQTEIEAQLIEVPAASWEDAAAKARYVMHLYSSTLGVGDTRHHDLIKAVLADFERLCAGTKPSTAD